MLKLRFIIQNFVFCILLSQLFLVDSNAQIYECKKINNHQTAIMYSNKDCLIGYSKSSIISNNQGNENVSNSEKNKKLIISNLDSIRYRLKKEFKIDMTIDDVRDNCQSFDVNECQKIAYLRESEIQKEYIKQKNILSNRKYEEQKAKNSSNEDKNSSTVVTVIQNNTIFPRIQNKYLKEDKQHMHEKRNLQNTTSKTVRN